eukprot:gene14395-biopygen1041
MHGGKAGGINATGGTSLAALTAVLAEGARGAVAASRDANARDAAARRDAEAALSAGVCARNCFRAPQAAELRGWPQAARPVEPIQAAQPARFVDSSQVAMGGDGGAGRRLRRGKRPDRAIEDPGPRQGMQTLPYAITKCCCGRSAPFAFCFLTAADASGYTG